MLDAYAGQGPDRVDPLSNTGPIEGSSVTVTTTDIGILLVVLCIVLWAIMAALHRHTVQMEALKKQMESLLRAQHHAPRDATEHVPAIASGDVADNLSVIRPDETLPQPKRHTFQDQ